MLRALAKGAGLFAFARTPGGAARYRRITREQLGTIATHVDKLARVWPGYVAIWRELLGPLDRLPLWVHGPGCTPYSPLAAYLLTGRAGAMTNGHERMHDRFLARALVGALATDFADAAVSDERRRTLAAQRWQTQARPLISALGGALHEDVQPARVPLPDASMHLCHSGGALEHYSPDALADFLAECRRVLRPGGLASHVFDHRDHLHHADARLPFLAHLTLPEPVYQVLCGHALGYHNRLSPTQVAARFERAGFEKIAVRRLVYPARRYAADDASARAGTPGLPRRLLAARFRALSELDLRTAAAHYLYRRR